MMNKHVPPDEHQDWVTSKAMRYDIGEPYGNQAYSCQCQPPESKLSKSTNRFNSTLNSSYFELLNQSSQGNPNHKPVKTCKPHSNKWGVRCPKLASQLGCTRGSKDNFGDLEKSVWDEGRWKMLEVL